MPLSEHEQRLLDQIERALYAEDPKFASTVRGAKLRRPSKRRRVQGIVLFVVGVAALVAGVSFLSKLAIVGIPVVSVFGFLLMFFGVLITLTTLRRGDQVAEGAQEDSKPTRSRSSFSERMEERFRRRFDDER